MNKTILILAASGRMLAQSAHQAGFAPLVIDLFADQDTLDVAEEVKRVNSLAADEVLPLANQFIEQYQVSDAIYGSGLESYPETLVSLNKILNVIGNSSQTFKRILNKKDFFRDLSRLEIPYPEVCFQAPCNDKLWLVKPGAGEGGAGIMQWRDAGQLSAIDQSIYWQRHIEGISLSILFLADGRNVRSIGFNRQWTESGSFVFSGIMKYPDLSVKIQDLVVIWLSGLVQEFNLQGLNSMDFIVEDESCLFLEINPRPSLSMALYEHEFRNGLLQEHIHACAGNIVFDRQIVSGIIGVQILYAQQTTHIPENLNWPDWSMDRPVCPCIIHENQPVCSIFATDSDMQQVYQQLQNKQNIIINSIEGRKSMEYTASVNQLTQPLVKELIENADKLRVNVEILENGCTIIDAGIKAPGGIEAGRLITEVCLGGMGTVTISHSSYTRNWPLTVNVHTGNPVLACLGSQYAGWSLAHNKYYALGSGPARAMASKIKDNIQEPVEALYKELGYQDKAGQTVLVIENDAVPPLEIVEKVASACNLAPEHLTIIVTPTSSLAGCVQVVGRVLEVAMHKAHELHFPLENIIDGSGSAPICPPHPDFVKAMGRTNDAILFAGQVHIFVKGSDAEAEKLANDLPSSTSKDYGKPFAEIFKAYEYDFFKVDGMLFSPASVIVTAVESGASFRAGKLDEVLLNQSFGA